MKIAMIGQKKVPSRLGGIEVAVEALAVRMARRGHEVTLYNCRRQTKKKKILRKRRRYRGVFIREIVVPDIRGLSAFLGSLAATLLALPGGYDCIHYHGEGPAAMAFLPKMLGIRTVVTVHGLDWQRSKWGKFASWYLRQGEKSACRFADEIIVLSRAVQEYFLNRYGRQTVMIPNGTTKPEKRTPRQIARWGLEKDGYILYLGRVVPEKGIENLIRAFLEVRTEKKLVIAGSQSDTKKFYEAMQAAAREDPRVLFTGFVAGDELDELYSNCYLYCLPSELEGMPLSLLEAMSYGCCCLCSDIPECAEVLGSGGVLFRTGSREDLSRKLQQLCDHRELVEAARERADEAFFARYDWEKIADQTLLLYQR